MYDIITVGEILIDLTQTAHDERGIPVFCANPGGAPANLAVAAAQLGASVAFIGKVGEDSFGAFLKEVLRTRGVDVSGMATDEKNRTTLAVVSLDASGERSFAFYRDPSADANLTLQDIPTSLVKNTKFMHFGSVSLTSEPARSATMYAVKCAKEGGALISYDPNYRPGLWSDAALAIRTMAEPLSMVDVLKVSEEELSLLSGTTDLVRGTAALAQKGIALVLVTLGAEGVFYRLGDSIGRVPAVKVEVCDTNGAGDTFLGAMLAQLARVRRPQDVTVAELEAMLAAANKAASITVSGSGAIPAMPTYAQVFGE